MSTRRPALTPRVTSQTESNSTLITMAGRGESKSLPQVAMVKLPLPLPPLVGLLRCKRVSSRGMSCCLYGESTLRWRRWRGLLHQERDQLLVAFRSSSFLSFFISWRSLGQLFLSCSWGVTSYFLAQLLLASDSNQSLYLNLI